MSPFGPLLTTGVHHLTRGMHFDVLRFCSPQASAEAALEDDTWESRADDLLAKDVTEIRRDLRQAPALLAMPARGYGGNEGWDMEKQVKGAQVRWPHQKNASSDRATSSGSTGA